MLQQTNRKNSKKAWHKSLQALNLCIQIPLVRDRPATRIKTEKTQITLRQPAIFFVGVTGFDGCRFALPSRQQFCSASPRGFESLSLQIRKFLHKKKTELLLSRGRSNGIRTHGLLVPKIGAVFLKCFNSEYACFLDGYIQPFLRK